MTMGLTEEADESLVDALLVEEFGASSSPPEPVLPEGVGVAAAGHSMPPGFLGASVAPPIPPSDGLGVSAVGMALVLSEGLGVSVAGMAPVLSEGPGVVVLDTVLAEGLGVSDAYPVIAEGLGVPMRIGT